MTFTASVVIVNGLVLLAASAAYAGPPGGVPVGPPAGIPHGPPAGIPHGPPPGIPSNPPASIPKGPPSIATARVPLTVTAGKPANPGEQAAPSKATAAERAATSNGVGSAAKLLKKLNAAHASDTAFEHASEQSVVGAIGKYKAQTLEAEADVAKYTDLVAQDQAAVDLAQAAVNDAQAAYDAALAATPADQATIDAAKATLDAAKATLASAQTRLSAHQTSLASAQQAIVDAQTDLASATNTTLSPEVVEKLNELLGI